MCCLWLTIQITVETLIGYFKSVNYQVSHIDPSTLRTPFPSILSSLQICLPKISTSNTEAHTTITVTWLLIHSTCSQSHLTYLRTPGFLVSPDHCLFLLYCHLSHVFNLSADCLSKTSFCFHIRLLAADPTPSVHYSLKKKANWGQNGEGKTTLWYIVLRNII